MFHLCASRLRWYRRMKQAMAERDWAAADAAAKMVVFYERQIAAEL